MSLIIFDYDGVLADTLDDLINFGQAACNELGVNHSVTKDDLGNLEEMSFDSFGQACGVPEPLNGAFVEICLKAFAEKESPPAIFAGMPGVIKYLSARHSLAVVTTNTSQNVTSFLEKHGLGACIQAIYGVESPGTKVQKITRARQHLSGSRNQGSVFMVGDSLSDVQSAKQASVFSVAVTWGHQSLEKLLGGKPDFVASSPHQLIEIIES